MKDFLEHYDTIIDAFYKVARQNKLLFGFLVEKNHVEEWNEFIKTKPRSDG